MARVTSNDPASVRIPEKRRSASRNRAGSVGRAGIALALLAILYVLNGVVFHFPDTLPLIGWITVPDDGREGWLEVVEAVLWFTSSIAFAALAIRTGRSGSGRLGMAWLLFFSVLCFVAAGEETSWGQHFGWFEVPAELTRLNAQDEVNLHNFDLGAFLNIDPDSVWYPLVGGESGITKLLNPLFYAFCVFVWAILPWFVERREAVSGLPRALRVFEWFPRPHVATRLFVIVNVLAYAIVDKLFYDVSELLELALSISSMLVVLDLMTSSDRERKASPQEG